MEWIFRVRSYESPRDWAKCPDFYSRYRLLQKIMKNISRLKWLFRCLILLTGCQNDKGVETRQFHSLGTETFSVISVVNDEDWLAETYKLNELFKDNVLKISVIGALKLSSSEAKDLVKKIQYREKSKVLMEQVSEK